MPVPFIPKLTFKAGVLLGKGYLPLIWDREKDRVKLTHNFIQANVSSFIKIVQMTPFLYQVVASPKAEHVGNYQGTITLTDLNKFPLSTEYAINLKITPDLDALPPEKPVRTLFQVIINIETKL